MTNSYYRKILQKSFFKTLNSNHIKLGMIGSDIATMKSKEWIGTSLCGPCCVISFAILKLFNIDNIKVFMNKRGFGEIYEDHVFIKIDDTIIDPTYRQFLSTTFDLDEIFIGNKDELSQIINKYGKKNHNMRHWECEQDITNKILDFIINTQISLKF